MSRRWKVLLCGYYGMGNLGDELLARACLHLLERCGVARGEIAMLSGNVQESQEFHGVQTFNRWSPKEIFSAARQSETLLLGGGGLFQDSTSLRSPLYYWLAVRAARLAGCAVWAVGQSVGPLKSPLSRALARDAFRSCKAVNVRDRHSFDFLDRRCLVSDDLVLALPEALSSTLKNTFLLNLRRWNGTLEHRAARAFSALKLPEGCSVVGVAMDKNDALLMERLRDEGELRLDELICPSFQQLSDVFNGASGAFGMRLHFGVQCLKSGVPCTLIPYDPKVSAFAQRWGARLWESGELHFPPFWERASEQRDAQTSLEKSFRECFEKALKK